MRVLIFGKGGMSAGIAEVLEHEVIEVPQEVVDVRVFHDVDFKVYEENPDWVINCAGISRPGSHIFDIHDEIETNLTGAFNVARASDFTPQIHIASVAGLYGKPGHAGYSASKAGVISMVQSLALEGKQIWAISPGRVDTPMRERDYPQDTPGSRLDPTDIGRVVKQIMAGYYESGTNVIIRKIGLTDMVIQAHTGDGWKEKLRVGEPVTI